MQSGQIINIFLEFSERLRKKVWISMEICHIPIANDEAHYQRDI